MNYFPGDWESWGLPEQNPVPFEPRMQKQLVMHPFLTLHEPPQVAEVFGPLRNCRAESVPAQRTAVTIAASSVDLIAFIFMA